MVLLGDNTCTDCTCWNTESSSQLLSFKPPKGYPIDEVTPSGHLLPLKLTYTLLNAAVKKTFSRITAGQWSKETATAFLTVHGLNLDCIKEVLVCSFNVLNFSIAESEKVQEPLDFEIFQMQKQQRPDLFAEWKPPAVWNRSGMVNLGMSTLLSGQVYPTGVGVENLADNYLN